MEVVLEATAFSLMSVRVDALLVATMVSTLFFFSAAELVWDWVSMTTAHSSVPHQDGMPAGSCKEEVRGQCWEKQATLCCVTLTFNYKKKSNLLAINLLNNNLLY